MSKIFTVCAFGLAALVASVAHAEGSATSQAPAANAAPQPDPNKVICKRVEDTGSNISGHVCKTRAEWAKLSEQHERETQDQIRRDRTTAGQGTGSAH